MSIHLGCRNECVGETWSPSCFITGYHDGTSIPDGASAYKEKNVQEESLLRGNTEGEI